VNIITAVEITITVVINETVIGSVFNRGITSHSLLLDNFSFKVRFSFFIISRPTTREVKARVRVDFKIFGLGFTCLYCLHAILFEDAVVKVTVMITKVSVKSLFIIGFMAFVFLLFP